jgi:hypothetical protein
MMVPTSSATRMRMMDANNRCNRSQMHADTERRHVFACPIGDSKVNTWVTAEKPLRESRRSNTAANHQKSLVSPLALNQALKLTVNHENGLLRPVSTHELQERSVLAVQDRQVDQRLRTLRNVVRIATNSVSSNSFRS